MTGIERLRRLARSQNMDNAWTAMLAHELCDIADQIGRETEEQSARLYDERVGEETGVCELFGVGPVDDPLTSLRRHVESLNDTIENLRLELGEARDDAAWVRGHGGLDQVKIDYDVYEGFSGLVDRIAARLGVSVEGLDDQDAEPIVTSALDRRLMPDGMEWLVEAWPRFEDNAPVRLLDDFERYGEENGVSAVTMYADGSFALNFRAYSKGERVKRPAPKVLDSEGVECNVGDAVWWVHNKTGNFRIIRIEQDGKCAIHDDDADEPCGMTVPSTELTHKRPVLDADGAEIRVGDTVYDVEDGCELVVTKVTSDAVFVAFEDVEADKYDASQLTHRAPVLAADGRPLREGEHVYHVGTGAELVVKELPKPGEYQAVVVFALPTSPASHLTSFDPDQLTHERPDSWERLEEDANASTCTYFGATTKDCEICGHVSWECSYDKASDLVRRAKKLAERDR